MRSRKAQVSQPWYLLLATLAMGMLILIFVLTVSKYQNQRIDTDQDLVLDIYMSRFTNSPDCFAFYDPELKRAYPGIIDFEKFNDTRLAECYDICVVKEEEDLIKRVVDKGEPEEICLRKFGFLFVLKDIDTRNEISKAKTENYLASSKTVVRPVLLKRDGITKKALLEIHIQRTLASMEFEAQKK